jgi:hypothetical protein
VEHLSQLAVVSQSRIDESLVEAGNGTVIHLVVLAIPTVHFDDRGLVTVGVRVNAGATERLRPVSGESFDMLGMEAVTERMANHFVGQHTTVPGFGKTSQATHTIRCLKDSLHAPS